jgi:hypothetical protein
LTKSETTLLTQEDRDLIAGIGFPLGPRPDLHVIAQDGQLLLTLKGRQFYKLLLTRLGLLHRLPSLVTAADLYDLKQEGLAILAAHGDQEVARALEQGQIPAQRVEVVTASLYGTLESFCEAHDRHVSCQAAGTNVIPGSFRKIVLR